MTFKPLVNCPYCHEMVEPHSVRCLRCNYELPEVRTTETQPVVPEPVPGAICNSCTHRGNYDRCKWCEEHNKLVSMETQPVAPVPVSSVAHISTKAAQAAAEDAIRSAEVSLPRVDVPLQLDTGYYFLIVEHRDVKLPLMKEVLEDRGVIIEPSAQCIQDFHRARFTAYSVVVKESMVFDALRVANARVQQLEISHKAAERTIKELTEENLNIAERLNNALNNIEGLEKLLKAQEPVSCEIGESSIPSADVFSFTNCTVQIFTSPAVATSLE